MGLRHRATVRSPLRQDRLRVRVSKWTSCLPPPSKRLVPLVRTSLIEIPEHTGPSETMGNPQSRWQLPDPQSPLPRAGHPRRVHRSHGRRLADHLAHRVPGRVRAWRSSVRLTARDSHQRPLGRYITAEAGYPLTRTPSSRRNSTLRTPPCTAGPTCTPGTCR